MKADRNAIIAGIRKDVADFIREMRRVKTEYLTVEERNRAIRSHAQSLYRTMLTLRGN